MVITSSLKSAYFLFLGPVMRINSYIYKRFFSPSKSKKKYFVQLGPGKTNYLDGWINVDSNIISGKLDVWCDLKYGLPFKKLTFAS